MSLDFGKSKSRGAEASGSGATAAARQQREDENKEKVLKRLKKTDIPPAEHDELALVLSNEERMKRRYFGDLLGSAQEAVEEVRRGKATHRGGIRTFREQKTCMEDIAKEVHRVKTIEVELAFSKLNSQMWEKVARMIHKYVKRFEYGAFHAAITIGNIVLEWNNTSLVIPRKRSDTTWLFRSSVHSREEGSEGMLCDPVPVRASAQETDEHFDHIVQSIDEIRKEKEVLVDELVRVAVNYNTKLHYDVLANNCQHFVRDCLHILGSPQESLPFEGKVRELADHLVRGRSTPAVMCNDFATHEELDVHVRSHMHEMTVEDMEYSICLYHIFHAFGGDPTKCSLGACYKNDLEQTLEKKKTDKFLSVQL